MHWLVIHGTGEEKIRVGEPDKDYQSLEVGALCVRDWIANGKKIPRLLIGVGKDTTQFRVTKEGTADGLFKTDDYGRVNDEFIKVNTVSTDGDAQVLSVTRAQLGTTATSHSADESKIYPISDAVWWNYTPFEVDGPRYQIDAMVSKLDLDMQGDLGKWRSNPKRYSKVARLPVFFVSPPKLACWVACTANLVNCLVVPKDGKVLMTDPCCEKFTQEVAAQLSGTGLQAEYLLEGWPCHKANGEIHCGTNPVRVPLAEPGQDWWQAWK
jgi:hypothetical protein